MSNISKPENKGPAGQENQAASSTKKTAESKGSQNGDPRLSAEPRLVVNTRGKTVNQGDPKVDAEPRYVTFSEDDG